MNDSLKNFVKLWNKEAYKVDYIESEDSTGVVNYMTAVTEAYTKQYTDKAQRRPTLSISKLYKPFAFLVLDRMGIVERSNYKLRDKFHTMNGDIWEAVIIRLLQDYDFPIGQFQQEVDYNGVPGHIDLVYNEDTVVDIKTMSHSYYQRFVYEPNDDRGYITQILCYMYALGLNKANILCVDKMTGKMSRVVVVEDDWFVLNEEMVTGEQLLDRVDKVIERYDYNISIDKLVDNFIVPIETIEYKYGIQVPESIRYDSRVRLIWNLDSKGLVKYQYTPEIIKRNIVEYKNGN